MRGINRVNFDLPREGTDLQKCLLYHKNKVDTQYEIIYLGTSQPNTLIYSIEMYTGKITPIQSNLKF